MTQAGKSKPEILVVMPQIRMMASSKTLKKQKTMCAPKASSSVPLVSAVKKVVFPNDPLANELLMKKPGRLEVSISEKEKTPNAVNELAKKEFDVKKEREDNAEIKDQRLTSTKTKVDYAMEEEWENFLKLVARVPDIDEISISGSLALEIITPNSLDETIQIEGAGKTIVSAAIGEYSEMDADTDYDFESSEEDAAIPPKPRLVEGNFSDLIKFDHKPFVKIGNLDFGCNKRLQEANQLKEDTKIFLDSLVDTVIKTVRLVGQQKAPLGNLSKVQLFEKLKGLLENRLIEFKINNFLKTKCVMHYRRLKSFRQITPEDVEDMTIAKKKFDEITCELNCLLGRQNAESMAISKRIRKAEETIIELEDKLKGNITQLEMVMRKAFVDRKSKLLKNTIKWGIREISILRDNISAKRLVLIKRQNTNGKLLDKAAKVEYMTDTLHFSQYEQMLNQKFGLEKRIELKTERLEKMRQQFYGITDLIAHIREKQEMVDKAVQSQLEKLCEADAEKHKLRLHNHQLKSQGLNIKKQLEKNSLEQVNRPELLIDFDKTVELGIQMKLRINQMKSEIERLEKKISMLHDKLKLEK